MAKNDALAMAQEIMRDFAARTGLSPASATPRRYLWTDAFAVCNYLELHRQSCDEAFKELALALVDQVHNILGRYRHDDPRRGWISGLDEAEGRLHPTAGGLRIGKKLNERGIADPVDADLEWEQDGQYYHYLTKWMHALNLVSTVTSEPHYNVWAKELARAGHAGFVVELGGQLHIRWKMSIDLSRPLVPAMGQHDPLDGFVTYHQLQACGPREGGNVQQPDLGWEIRELESICRGRNWATDDALGIGGLLCNAWQTARLIAEGYSMPSVLLPNMLEAALAGLSSVAGQNISVLPADYRLAFRELGLSIGMHAAERLQGLVAEKPTLFAERGRLSAGLTQLLGYKGFADDLENFWLAERNREAKTWADHRDINMVMLATSLAPDGFLRICGK
jgi:hypothetical protein